MVSRHHLARAAHGPGLAPSAEGTHSLNPLPQRTSPAQRLPDGVLISATVALCLFILL